MQRVLVIERARRYAMRTENGSAEVLFTPAPLPEQLASPSSGVYTRRQRAIIDWRQRNRVFAAVTNQDNATLEQLLARSAQGDQAAFAAFYDRTAARVFGLAKRIVRRSELAEDAAAEAYAQAWANANTFDVGRGNALCWLLMIARSRALDLLRRRAREVSLEDVAANDEPEDSASDTFNIVAQFEHASLVSGALTALTDTQRLCVALSFFQDLSHSEIAEQLRMPLGTVKTQLRGAIQVMREMLRVTKGEQEGST